MKMRGWFVFSALTVVVLAASMASAQSVTFGQFTQPQPTPEFAVLQNTLDTFTLTTADPTAGAPVNFGYLFPEVKQPELATMFLNAVSTGFTSLDSTTYRIEFNNPQANALSIKDAQGNTLLSGNFTGDLFLTGVNGGSSSSPVASASFNSPAILYTGGIYPPAGSLGTFSIALSGLIPETNGLLAAGAGTFDITSVPEPASLSILAMGLGAVALRRRPMVA